MEISIRRVSGTTDYPQIGISKELRRLNLKRGDFVKIYINGNKIIIEKMEVR